MPPPSGFRPGFPPPRSQKHQFLYSQIEHHLFTGGQISLPAFFIASCKRHERYRGGSIEADRWIVPLICCWRHGSEPLTAERWGRHCRTSRTSRTKNGGAAHGARLLQTAVQGVWGQRPHKERHSVFLLLTCLRYLLQIPLFFRKKRAIPSRSFAKLFQKRPIKARPTRRAATPRFSLLTFFSREKKVSQMARILRWTLSAWTMRLPVRRASSASAIAF